MVRKLCRSGLEPRRRSSLLSPRFGGRVQYLRWQLRGAGAGGVAVVIGTAPDSQTLGGPNPAPGSNHYCNSDGTAFPMTSFAILKNATPENDGYPVSTVAATTEYANVDPLGAIGARDPIRDIPAGYQVQWRYVTLDAQFVLVRDPTSRTATATASSCLALRCPTHYRSRRKPRAERAALAKPGTRS